jgi:hypothetical protein
VILRSVRGVSTQRIAHHQGLSTQMVQDYLDEASERAPARGRSPAVPWEPGMDPQRTPGTEQELRTRFFSHEGDAGYPDVAVPALVDYQPAFWGYGAGPVTPWICCAGIGRR